MHQRAVVDDFSIEQIVPFFQPIYELNSHKVNRYECLARLVTEDDNIYLPSEFLYIVSRSQSNAQLTQRILELSGAYCSTREMSWSINMFQSDLRDAALIKWMKGLIDSLDNNALSGHLHDFSMGVEISYCDVKDQPHLLSNLLEKLPRVHVAIDDVYEASADLNAVLETGIHTIKLRGDIVTRYARSGENKQLIKQLIDTCRFYNCDLVAEHIEDDNTLDAILELGINFGQGYFLSAPKGRMTNLKQV